MTKKKGMVKMSKLPDENHIRISVAMAVYNAEKYIRKMLDSIVPQLRSCDELVISYNESSDATWDIILSYSKKYPNVYVVTCEKTGIIPNFENAIRHCRGRYILLADQDDVWTDAKVECMYKAFKYSKKAVVLHDCLYVTSSLRPMNRRLSDRGLRAGSFYNLVKNSYQGSCMGFRRSVIPAILPIPEGIAMHDQWIGIIGNIVGGTYIMKERLMLYRQHEGNSSSDRLPILRKLRYMFIMAMELQKRMRKILFVRSYIMAGKGKNANFCRVVRQS